MHPYSGMDMTAAWKKLHFILLDKSDFHVTDSLLIAVYVFANYQYTSKQWLCVSTTAWKQYMDPKKKKLDGNHTRMLLFSWKAFL